MPTSIPIVLQTEESGDITAGDATEGARVQVAGGPLLYSGLSAYQTAGAVDTITFTVYGSEAGKDLIHAFSVAFGALNQPSFDQPDFPVPVAGDVWVAASAAGGAGRTAKVQARAGVAQRS